MRPITKTEILSTLNSLGIKAGQTLMVHTALSQIGYVCGGAQTVIEALLEAVGEAGTVMMPTQSWKNLDPEDGVHWSVEKEYWHIIRENWPAYDKRITPTNTMGAVAEMFRSWPGVIRSDHPARSVAAWGTHAEYLASNHDLSNIFGEGCLLLFPGNLSGQLRKIRPDGGAARRVRSQRQFAVDETSGSLFPFGIRFRAWTGDLRDQ